MVSPIVREILNAVTTEPDQWTVAALADDLGLEPDMVWRAIEGPLRQLVARGRHQRLRLRVAPSRHEPATERVFAALEATPGAIRAPELAHRLGLEVTGVRRSLRSLARQERIPMPAYGLWRHPSAPLEPVVGRRRRPSVGIDRLRSGIARRYRGLRSLLVAVVLTEQPQSVDAVRDRVGLRQGSTARALRWLEAHGLACSSPAGWTDNGAIPIGRHHPGRAFAGREGVPAPRGGFEGQVFTLAH